MMRIFIFSVLVFQTFTSLAESDIELRKNTYSASLLPLGTGYQAKLYCSCLFVMKREQAYCEKFIEVSPKIFRVQADLKSKKIEARALYFFSKSTAQYLDGQGCVLQ